MSISNIAIFAKVHDPRCQTVASELVTWLESRNCVPLLESHLAQHLGYALEMTSEEIRDRAELVVVLGGDGTLLSVSRLFCSRGIPILGVNLGSLGFLTEITVEELYPVLEQCLQGNPRSTQRMMLDVEVIRGTEQLITGLVLNEIVINKGALARIVDLKTMIDEHFLTTFKADGLIVSTPTGSTGYTLSAGGPIIHPQLSCIVITPICPHTLTNRPIVVSDDSVISITVTSAFDEKVYLTLDGQVGCKLQEGDLIKVSKASTRTMLVASQSRDYFEVIRTKLKWGER